MSEPTAAEIVRATAQRNEFVARKERARVRAAEYNRDLIPLLSFGVSAEMLANLLDPQNELKPKTAKEAIEVAKIALEIGRREMGEGEPGVESLTGDQRQAKIDKANELLAQAQAAAERLGQAGGRPVAVPDLTPDAS